MRQSGEPSVEEILQSIKQVMTREGPVGAERTVPAGDAAGPNLVMRPDAGESAEAYSEDPGEFGDGVLELTEVVEQDDAAFSQRIEPSQGQPAGSDDDQPLLASERQAAMRDSLSALAVLAEPGTAAQIVRSAENSLDGLTRELLRPMLAEWLDRNLPPLVERLVKAEIARIAGPRG